MERRPNQSRLAQLLKEFNPSFVDCPYCEAPFPKTPQGKIDFTRHIGFLCKRRPKDGETAQPKPPPS